MVLLALVVVPVGTLANGYDSSLMLENKNWDTDWSVESDAISGTLDFNSSGANFEFSLSATGLANGEYSLIYYADNSGDRFGEWGGDNPGAVIWSGSSNGGSLSSGNQSIDLGMNLPSSPDANMSEHSYCQGPDNYMNCHGAKIWLIPSSALTGSATLPVIVWPPDDNWLFETNLITYDDTDIIGGSEVALTTIIPEDAICVSVMPNSLDFGSVYRGQCKELMQALTITNCGNVPITVTALASGSLYTGNLEISHGVGWNPVATWSTMLATGASSVIHVKLCVPSDFPVGTATGALSFIAQE